MHYELCKDPMFDAMPKPQGWEYRDMAGNGIPMTEFLELLRVIGIDNFKTLGMTRRRNPDGTIVARAQLLLSPEGLRNIEAHNKASCNA